MFHCLDNRTAGRRRSMHRMGYLLWRATIKLGFPGTRASLPLVMGKLYFHMDPSCGLFFTQIADTKCRLHGISTSLTPSFKDVYSGFSYRKGDDGRGQLHVLLSRKHCQSPQTELDSLSGSYYIFHPCTTLACIIVHGNYKFTSWHPPH